MIVIPEMLTKICAHIEPELSISMKWPTKERNTPTQNTASHCWPHLMTGSQIFHSRPGQSFFTNLTVRTTMTTKCKKRYQARLVLSFGLKAEKSQSGNKAPKSGNLPANVMIIAKKR